MKFKFKAPPIVAKFMKDDAHMRVIKGPQGPVSGDTEFLTPHGWKRMDAYAAGDEVAEWEPAGGTTTFRKPQEYHVKACEEFLHFKNEHSLSMVLSEEHRVPCYDWKGVFKVTTAAALARRPSKTRIPTTFIPTVPGVLMQENEIRLLVAQHADGHIDSSNATIITVRKERKKERLRWLLRRNSIEFRERTHAQRPTETIFRFRWRHTSKTFESWWYGLNASQLRAVLQEASLWDGMEVGVERVYYSRHKADADFIQYAAHATGGRATISRIVQRKSVWADNYAVHIALPGSLKAPVFVRKDNTTIARVPSADERKYCFTTSTGFFVARHNGCVFVTGNSGKSSGSCIEILRRCIQREQDSDGKRRAKFVVVRNTIPMLRDTTIPTFLRWFPHGTLGQWHQTDKYYHFRFGDVDAQVLFRALDDKEDIAKLLSSEYTGCYFNEFREIDPVIHEAMTKRVGRWVTDPGWSKEQIDRAWYGIWADTNPPQVGSWHHQMMEKEIPNNWSVYHQPSGRSAEAENREHLRSDYYDIDGLSPEYVRVMIDGEYGYDQSGLPVFGNTFLPHWHVSADPLRFVPSAPLVIGLDAGLTPAAVFGQQDYKGRLLCLGECYVPAGETMGMERFVTTRLLPYMAMRFPGAGKAYVTGDPAISQRGQANELTPFDILVKYFHVSLAWSDKLPARINAGESWLAGQVEGKPKLLIDPSCKGLQRTLAHNYRFAKKRDVGLGTDVKDAPEKNHPWSDIADAWMYLLMHAGGGAVPMHMQQQKREVQVASAKGWT